MLFNRLLPLLVNIATLKVGWLLAVVGAGNGIGWAGPMWALVVVGVYLSVSRDRRGELQLVAVACAIGALLDTLTLRFGFIEFSEPGPMTGFAPLWIIGLWALLATAMTRSLAWLAGRPWVATGIGLTLAPLSYWAGVTLGAAEFSAGLTVGLTANAIAWGAALPLLAFTANRVLTHREWRESSVERWVVESDHDWGRPQ